MNITAYMQIIRACMIISEGLQTSAPGDRYHTRQRDHTRTTRAWSQLVAFIVLRN